MNGRKKYRDVLSVPPELIGQLRGFASQAEAGGALTVGQLDIIRDQGWFKLFVPGSLGGLELPLPEAVRLEEVLARIDGSLGWTVTLCAGANLFVGYIDRSIAPAVFADRAVCLGGSGQASGNAVRENGGYRVSGKWGYATGAPHLTHFTVNCLIDGTDVVKSFFFAKADVRIVEDWNTFGLKATASHSFEVDNLWVDESHAFSIEPQLATWHHPIYRYPFLPLAEVTLAVNTLGMARHFLECAVYVGTPDLLAKVEMAEAEMQKTRAIFYEKLDASWDELIATGELSPEMSAAIAKWSRALVGISREKVVAIYPHMGLIAADASSTANRIWRDLFTASQHSLLR